MGGEKLGPCVARSAPGLSAAPRGAWPPEGERPPWVSWTVAVARPSGLPGAQACVLSVSDLSGMATVTLQKAGMRVGRLHDCHFGASSIPLSSAFGFRKLRRKGPWPQAFFRHPRWLSSLLQDLGVTKVGHMKRILCGIKELGRSSAAAEA